MDARLTLDGAIVLCIIAAVLVAFYRRWASPDIVALSGAGACLIAGVIDAERLIGVFSNPGPVTVAAMFILTAALQRTGVMAGLADFARRSASGSGTMNLLVLMVAVMGLSAFVNNTPVVLMLAPVVISMAQDLDDYPTRYLIPLSYASIFGGATTIIGTSTNLIVDGVASDRGLEPFSMFELALPGVIMGAVGIAYMMTIGRKLLPRRRSAGQDPGEPEANFLTELVVTRTSELLGERLDKAVDEDDVELVDLIRSGETYGPDAAGDIELQSGDRIVVRASPGEAVHLRRAAHPDVDADAEAEAEQAGEGEDDGSSGRGRSGASGLQDRLAALGVHTVSEEATVIRKGVIGPGSRYEGRQVGRLNLRRLYDVRILGVQRSGGEVEESFKDLQLQVGDTLLMEGPADGLKRLFNQGDIVSLSQPEVTRRRREKAPIAIGAVIAFVVVAATGLLPIAGAAIAAAVAVMALGCVRSGEAYQAIDWKILFLIFGMLGLGAAMQESGAAAFLVQAAAGPALAFGPIAVLAVIYLVTSILTETVTNNAAAILLTPIAIGLADQMGVDARPFVVAVMFAASASFATPLGYQTNTLVYGAGGYTFLDFTRVGLPLNLLMWGLAVVLIPLVWSF